MPYWYNVLASVSFVGTLTAFAICTFVDLEGAALTRMGVTRGVDWDQRAKTDSIPIPHTYDDWVLLPDKCSNYVDDHFGFRYSLVRVNRKLYRDVFQDSDAQNMLLGQNGWRFLRGTNSVIEYTEHRYPLSDDELGLLVSALESTAKSLRELSVPFFLVVAPNKHSIYPELLPTYIKRSPTTRLDQIMSTASIAALFPFDLRQEFAAQKEKGQLYERTGTHWTDLGMWWGFQRIMLQVKQVYRDHKAALPDVDFVYTEQGPFEFGDQTERLPELRYTDLEAVRNARREQLAAATEEMTAFQKRHLSFRVQGLGTGHVVVFRDSFFTRMVPLFATQFETIDLYWQTYVDMEIVRTTKPDLVILEFAERHLMDPGRFVPATK